MRGRAATRWILGVAIASLGAWTACGFPSVSFLPDEFLDGGADGTTVDGATGTDASAADVASDAPPPPVNVDDAGEFQDATTADDASVTPIDAAGCVTCDCDNDGYNKRDCGAGPEDCDDTIAAIHPDAGYLENGQWLSLHAPAFDWNCDGTPEQRLAYNGVCDLTNCRNGFDGGPQCGQTAYFFRCKPKIGIGGVQLGCEVDLAQSENRTQGCR